MEHEKGVSSHSQNLPERRGLLSTVLLSGLGLWFFWSRRKIQGTQEHDHTIHDSKETDCRDSHYPHNVNVVAELHTPEYIETKRAKYDESDNRLHKWMVWGTWLTLFAAAFYGCVTYKMWREMQETTKSTLQAFRIDERAWVGIEPIKPILRSPHSDKFGASFVYEIYPRNTGKTVARHVEVRAQRNSSVSSVAFGDSQDQMNRVQDELLLNKFKNSEDIPFLRSAPRTLAPGQMAPIPLTIFGQEPQVFPKDEWVSFLIGRIDYADEFGIQHWVKFCFFVQNARGELEHCKYGNDEDNSPENP